MALLEFQNFSLDLKNKKESFNLIHNISFQIQEGHALGIVGESGCGKSMTSLSTIRLLPSVAKTNSGSILFRGEDLLSKTETEMQDIRGKDIAMIFQEPMTSLNPVLKVGKQIGEMFMRHMPELSKQEIANRTLELLNDVGIPDPKQRINEYPHQFSGGMRQRVMIAMAMACKPALLIADEPTTALDVTIQAQVLDLMNQLKATGSLMLVTHNLGIVAEICDEVVVMYAGCVIEKGSVESIFRHPLHPYTQGLMAAIPTLQSKKERLFSIPGTVPSVKNFEKGCRFAPRCERNLGKKCFDEIPPDIQVESDHSVQCWLLEKEGI